MIRTAGKVLQTEVNDYIDYTRLSKGTFKLREEVFNVQDQFVEMLHMFKMTTRDKRIKLKFKIQQHVPEYVKSDASRILQILRNYVANAVKFTMPGGTIKIIVEYNSELSEMKITVRDTGVGIKRENLEQLFKPFSMLDDPMNLNSNGVGLGLNICKKIAEKLGGQVFVQSEVGKGSNFGFTARAPRATCNITVDASVVRAHSTSNLQVRRGDIEVDLSANAPDLIKMHGRIPCMSDNNISQSMLSNMSHSNNLGSAS